MDEDYKSNQTKLPGDSDPPFSAPDDAPRQNDMTHPQTDTNADPDEAYQEGTKQASGLQDAKS